MSKCLGIKKNRGLSKTPTYRAWNSMMARCYHESQDSFHLYGGRGIQVCERWHEYANFLADMGEKTAGMSLERKGVDGDYEPGNCEWIPLAEQQRNKRNSRLLTYYGLTKTMAEWSEDFSLSTCLIHWRLKHGWTVEKTLNTPARHMKSPKRKEN